jgi:hypothetical protein
MAQAPLKGPGLSAGYDHLSVLHRFMTSQDEGRPSLPRDPKGRRLIVGLASEIIFDMKYEIAHILSDDNSIGLQLAQIMRQHLPGRSRNEPRKLTQADRARSQRKSICALHLL